MSVTWPTIFPSPSLFKYSIRQDESIARTKMDSGVARQRRRYTTVPSNVKVSWVMNDEIFGYFESWYKYKAKAGSEWVNLTLKNGLGLESTEVRFFKPYIAKPISGNIWSINAELEVRSMLTLSEQHINLILNLGLNLKSLIIMRDKLSTYVNVEKAGIYKW